MVSLWSTCRDCFEAFAYDADQFDRRGLSHPTRCIGCRSQRRAALQLGTIAFIAARWGFIQAADDGQRFYFEHADMGDDARVPQVGERVHFMVEHARARRVRVLGDAETDGA